MDIIPERQDALDALTRKYFTPEPVPNGDGPPAVAAELTDEEVIARCRRARNAAKFSDLYDDGNANLHHGGDESRAELALAAMFSYHTPDAAQIERLMDSSALGQRPKWRKRADYRRMTIAKALDGRHSRPRPLSSPSPSPYIESDGDGGVREDFAPVRLSEREEPRGKRPYLVEGVLPARFTTAFYGDGGTAKTTAAMHLIQCLARGEGDWLGHKIAKAVPALFLDFELDLEEHLRRAYEIAHGLGYTTPPDDLHYMSAAGRRSRDVFADALAFCREEGVSVVVVDSLGVAMEGDAEASSDVLAFMREVLDPFRAAGITLVVVDHQSKMQAGESYQKKTMFGSVYKTNTIRSVFQVEVRERQDDGLKLTLRHKKTNFGPLRTPFGAYISWSAGKTTLAAEALTSGELAEEGTMNVTERVLHALEDGPAYPEDLAVVVEAQPRTVKNKLSELRKSGKVEDTGQVRNRSHEVRLKPPSPRHSPISDGDGDDSAEEPFEEVL